MAGFDRFTNQVRRMLDLARDEAIRFLQDAIGSEHILLGILRGGESSASRMLLHLGLSVDRTRQAISELASYSEQREAGPGPHDALSLFEKCSKI